MKIAQFHPLHVSRSLAFDCQRLVGPFALEVLRHVPHHPHDILFSEIAVDIRPHLSGMVVVEGIEVHVGRSCELGVGCAQVQVLHMDGCGIQCHLGGEFIYLQSAFLLEGA